MGETGICDGAWARVEFDEADWVIVWGVYRRLGDALELEQWMRDGKQVHFATQEEAEAVALKVGGKVSTHRVLKTAT